MKLILEKYCSFVKLIKINKYLFFYSDCRPLESEGRVAVADMSCHI